MLSQKLINALKSSKGIADNHYLERLQPALAELDQAYQGNPALTEYVMQLDELLSKPHFELEPHLTNKFAQLLGEAHFWLLCTLAELNLKRVCEQNGKRTPDFELCSHPGEAFFEVKTLSVATGDLGVAKTIADSLLTQLDLERQLHAGKRVACATTEIASYGEQDHGCPDLLHATRVLIEKARQNFKTDQFANPNTFLVLNLCMLHPIESHPRILRPSYPDLDGQYPTSVTGQLWALAFGHPEMLVQGHSEFEGKPFVLGKLDKEGILREFENIKGILFMIHPLQEPACVWALLRSYEKLNDENPQLLEEILRLTGIHQWNDELDCNGFVLN
ncbi:hypothetical protein [Pseudomonas protegens]|uniref:hypothetical protein n=1 Tax=Pseudomonas protegens TaxID=380021 RepID=UPI0030C660EE